MDLFMQVFLNPVLLFIKANWWVVVLALLLFYLWRNRARIRGAIWRARVSGIIKTLPAGRYILLRDVLLETEQGTARVGRMVLSVYGIFVIETVGNTGTIYGRYHDRRWVAESGAGARSFMNPIHQSYGQIHAIERALGTHNHALFFPIVVFGDQCELRLSLEDDTVVHLSGLKEEISRHKKNLLTAQQARDAAQKIRACNIPGRAARRAHARHVRAYQKLRAYYRNGR